MLLNDIALLDPTSVCWIVYSSGLEINIHDGPKLPVVVCYTKAQENHQYVCLFFSSNLQYLFCGLATRFSALTAGVRPSERACTYTKVFCSQ